MPRKIRCQRKGKKNPQSTTHEDRGVVNRTFIRSSLDQREQTLTKIPPYKKRGYEEAWTPRLIGEYRSGHARRKALAVYERPRMTSKKKNDWD